MSLLCTLFCLALLVFDVHILCSGILKVTGWTDPQERKVATIAMMTAALLNSDKTPKTK